MASLPKFTLYRGFAPTPNHVWSPFVNKLETRLRLGGITSYTLETGNPRQAPRGKIPYISLPDSFSPRGGGGGQLLGDTALITANFIREGVLRDLNAGLSPAEAAQDLAIRALCEDKLYFYLTRERWVDNFYTMRDGVLAALPYPVRVLVGNLAYRGVTSTLHGQGAGRYSDNEVHELKKEVWESLDALVSESRMRGAHSSDGPFWVLGKEKPTEADATVYGFVVASLVCTAAPETQKTVRGFPSLVDYAKRIHDIYFGEYDLWEEHV